MCMFTDLWSCCCGKRQVSPRNSAPNARVARRQSSSTRHPASRRASVHHRSLSPEDRHEKRHRSTSQPHDPEKRRSTYHHHHHHHHDTTPRTSKHRVSSSDNNTAATSGGPSRRRSKTVTSATTSHPERDRSRRPRSYSTATDDRRSHPKKPVSALQAAADHNVAAKSESSGRDAAFRKLSQEPVKRRRSKLQRSRSITDPDRARTKSDLKRRHTTIDKESNSRRKLERRHTMTEDSAKRHNKRARSHSPDTRRRPTLHRALSSSSPSRKRSAAEVAALGEEPVTVRSMKQRSGYQQHITPRYQSPQTGEIFGEPELKVENIPALAAWAIREARSSTSETSSNTVKKRRRAEVGFTYREDESTSLPVTQIDFHRHLVSHLESSNLGHLLPTSQDVLHHISTLAATSAPVIARSLELPPPATLDLTILGLYDIYLLLDNSTSMNTPQNWPSLITATHHITALASRYNPNGLTIRFLHHPNDSGFNGIATEPQVDTTLSSATPAPGSPLGTRAFEKLVAPLASQPRTRPALVVVITDGIIDHEPRDRFRDVMIAGQGKVGREMLKWAVCVVGADQRMREWVEGLRRERDLRGSLYVVKEGVDYVVEKSKTVGELNTWLTQMMAAAVKR